MIDSTEMKKRIFAALEEAGNEHADALLNTVIDPTGDPTEPAMFERCLRELFADGLIVMGTVCIPRGRESLTDEEGLAEIGKISAHYKFHPSDGIWLDSRFGGPPYYQTPEPEVILTDAGFEKSVSVVEKIGHNWWRPKR